MRLLPCRPQTWAYRKCRRPLAGFGVAGINFQVGPASPVPYRCPARPSPSVSAQLAPRHTVVGQVIGGQRCSGCLLSRACTGRAIDKQHVQKCFCQRSNPPLGTSNAYLPFCMRVTVLGWKVSGWSLGSPGTWPISESSSELNIHLKNCPHSLHSGCPCWWH